jgi:hypothetical protein
MNRNIIYMAVVSCIMTAACSKAIPDGFGVENAGQYATVYLGAAFHGNLEKILVPEQDETFNIYANYSGLLDLESPVYVTFEANPELVAEYNDVMSAAYKVLPAQNYILEHRTVAIAAGSMNSDAMKVTLCPDGLLSKGPYMLPVTISNVSDKDMKVNEDLKTLYIVVKYDDSSLTFENYEKIGWEVVDCSYNAEGHGPEAVLDGDPDTWWEGVQTLDESMGQKLTHSLTVDMLRPVVIHGLGIRARTRMVAGAQYHYAGQPRQVEVELSTDKQTWVKVQKAVVLPFGIESSIRFEEYMKARYVRLTVNNTWLTKQQDGCYLSFSELNIF